MPISLVLVRHAPAGDPDLEKYPDDKERPLTEVGVKKFKKSAAGMKNVVKPDAVVAAPAARCLQTADLLTWDGDWPAATANEVLEDGHEPEDVLDMIRRMPGKPKTLGIVGHGDGLSALAGHLIGGKQPLEFEKGAAAQIDMPKRSMQPGTGTLKWAMRRKEIKAHR